MFASIATTPTAAEMRNEGADESADDKEAAATFTVHLDEGQMTKVPYAGRKTLRDVLSKITDMRSLSLDVMKVCYLL